MRLWLAALVSPFDALAQSTPQEEFARDVLMFRSDIWYEPLDGRPKYQLLTTETVPTGITQQYDGEYVVKCVGLDESGHLTLDAGFQWNGPSWIFDYASLMKASAYHDALYRLMRARGLHPREARRKADELFATVAEREDFPSVPARASKYVLHGLGRFGARHKKEGKTLCAEPELGAP